MKNYDCYDDDLAPQKWIEKCRNENGAVAHARCPLFVDGQYKWTDVHVEGYDEKRGRFRVKTVSNGQIKEVIRLSLLFRDEDEEKFKERVEIAKMRQATANDEMRFLKLVESLPDDLFAKLPNAVREAIL